MTPNAPHSLFRWRAAPKSPFHFGDRGDRASTDLWPRSDTLFGAFLAASALHSAQGRPFMPEGDPPRSAVQFSSLFPAWGDVRFLPRPYVRPNLNSGNGATDRKAFGKVHLVSERVFLQLLNGAPVAFDRHLRIGDLFLLHPDDLPGGPARWQQSGRPPLDSLLETDAIAGNVLDRLTSAADTFRRAAVRLNASAAFWGLVRCPADAADTVRDALAELGRHGLGGLRSIGFGAFEVASFEPLPADDPLAPLLQPPEPSAATHLCLLSLYHPTRAEVESGVIGEDDPHVGYDALRRGGWIWSAGDTGLRKRTIRMLTEGSVVRRVGDNGPTGNLEDVAPKAFRNRPRSHPVWRDGRAFALAFSPKEVSDDE